MLKNSQSIEESKRNGVFIQALKVINPIINIGNNKTDTITQIWLENEWTYESKYIFSTVIQKGCFWFTATLLFSISTFFLPIPLSVLYGLKNCFH